MTSDLGKCLPHVPDTHASCWRPHLGKLLLCSYFHRCTKIRLGGRYRSRSHPLLVRQRRHVRMRSHLCFLPYSSPFFSQANSSHFWLNEGFTTYIERVLLEKLHSPADRGFSYLIGWKGLQDDLKLFESRPKYRRLVIEFEKGEDPDDAYSRVPYDKGANFLLYLGKSPFMSKSRCILTATYRTHSRWIGHLPQVYL